MARSLLLVLCGAAALINAAALAVVLVGTGTGARPSVLLGLGAVLLLPLLLAAAITGSKRSRFSARATSWFVAVELLGVAAVGLAVSRGALSVDAVTPVLLGAISPPSGVEPSGLANRTRPPLDVTPPPPPPGGPPGVYGFQYQERGSAHVVDTWEEVPPALRASATRIRIVRPNPDGAPVVGGGRVSDDQQRILDELNAHRRAAGLSPVTLDPALSEGCQRHADYLARNYGDPATDGLKAHSEDRRLPGYSDEGAQAAARSTIAHSSDTSAVAMWSATLYHRVPLLDPRLQRIGLGIAEVPRGRPTLPANLPASFRLLTTVMNVGERGADLDAVVLYPGDGQREVPLGFGEGEVPNPLERDPDGRAGYAISATFFSARGTPRISAATARLRDDRGRAVPVHLNAPEAPLVAGYGLDTVGLIPVDPLQPRTGYQVEVEATVDGRRLRKAWRFTTTGLPPRPDGLSDAR